MTNEQSNCPHGFTYDESCAHCNRRERVRICIAGDKVADTASRILSERLIPMSVKEGGIDEKLIEAIAEWRELILRLKEKRGQSRRELEDWEALYQLNLAGLNDIRAAMAEATADENQRLRDGVKALADEWEAADAASNYPGATDLGSCANQLYALLSTEKQ